MNLPRWCATITLVLTLAGCACGNSCGPNEARNLYDCGCTTITGPPPPPPRPNYSITRRYYCSDKSDCTNYESGSSCQDAQSAQESKLRSFGNPCRDCFGQGYRDESRSYTGRFDSIQLGPC